VWQESIIGKCNMFAFLKLCSYKGKNLFVFACLPFSEKSEKWNEIERSQGTYSYSHIILFINLLYIVGLLFTQQVTKIFTPCRLAFQIGVSKRHIMGDPFGRCQERWQNHFCSIFLTCDLRCAHIAISRKARFVLQPHNAFKGTQDAVFLESHI